MYLTAKILYQMLVNKSVTDPCIHEYEVHLHEGEDELGDGVDASQDHVAGRVQGDLQEHSKLEAIVYHRAKAKGCSQHHTLTQLCPGKL